MRLGWLVANVLHDALNFLLPLGGGRQQRQARAPAVVAVQVHRVLDAGNAELTDETLRGSGDALLLFLRQVCVPFLPGGVDLEAGRGRRVCEGEDGADGADVERVAQRLR